MANSYDEDKLDYADGYIPNNPKEETIDEKIEEKVGKKSSNKSGGIGFFITVILAFLIIAVGILTNALLQLKAQEQLKGEQLEYTKKQLEAYKKVISEIDFAALYEDAEAEENNNEIANEVASENVVDTNTVANETVENTVQNVAESNTVQNTVVENNTVSENVTGNLFVE